MFRIVILTVLVISSSSSSSFANDQAETRHELFSAIEQQIVAVQVFAVDRHRVNVLIENLGDDAIAIAFPPAVAAIPSNLLGQLGMGMGNGNAMGMAMGNGMGNGMGVGNGGGGGQNVGGNFGAQGNGNPGGALFHIPAGKTRKAVATTVCLQHGRPDPNPRMDYVLARIEDVTQDRRLVELCAAVGETIDRSTAQAAAWHLADRMSWSELASLDRVRSAYRGRIKRFDAKQIAAAKRWVETRGVATLRLASERSYQFVGP